MEHVLVVVPTYNMAQYIEETLEGIRNQNGDFITHVIVCDDASTDDTDKRVKEYREKYPDLDLAFTALEKNSGTASRPRNRAIDYAIGKSIPFDYIALCDADDVWLPHKLQGQLDLFTAKPGLGLVYSRGLIHRRESHDFTVHRRLVTGFWKFMLFFHITASSVVLKRRAVEKFFPLFDEDPRLRVGEDSECWARLFSSGIKAGAVDTVDLIYRIHSNALTPRVYGEIRKTQDNLYEFITRKAGKSRFLLFICKHLKLLRYSDYIEQFRIRFLARPKA